MTQTFEPKQKPYFTESELRTNFAFFVEQLIAQYVSFNHLTERLDIQMTYDDALVAQSAEFACELTKAIAESQCEALLP